ncbi:MAG TPA: hypothetical protein VHI52_21175 [Verrucomicrobiae bacterium]|nr:hypothetical protein [Verrucomicrobiae bacterium]
MKATRLLTFAPLFLLAPCLLAASESRTWTFNGDGNISSGPGIWSFRKGGRIDGRFVRLDGTNAVIVKLVDGTARSVPYAALSEADQAYLARLKHVGRPGGSQPVPEPKLAIPAKNDTTIYLVDILEKGTAPEFPYTPVLTACDLPRTREARAACEEVLQELHQIQKGVEPEISYDQFCALLSRGSAAIRKIQGTGHGIPKGFNKRADKCLGFYEESKAAWEGENQAKAEREKREFHASVQRNWIKAEMEILRCEGICENDPTVNDEILAKESMLVYTDKKLEGMTTVEIFDRFRNMITRANRSPLELDNQP